MSPCKACAGSQKKLGIPTLENVAEIFLAIKPDFPTPAKITLPLQFKIKSTALINDLLKNITLKSEKLTTRDSRSVERKKPGRRKARRSFQFSKR